MLGLQEPQQHLVGLRPILRAQGAQGLDGGRLRRDAVGTAERRRAVGVEEASAVGGAHRVLHDGGESRGGFALLACGLQHEGGGGFLLHVKAGGVLDESLQEVCPVGFALRGDVLAAQAQDVEVVELQRADVLVA